MKRRSITMIVLGGIVLLLALTAGLLAWHPWSVPAAATAAAAEPPLKFVQISQVSSDLIRSIDLIGPAGTIEIDSTKGVWQIVKPAVLDVQESPMNDILYSLGNLASERVIEENPKDLSIYGLKPPAITVRYTLISGEVHELYLGDLTPAGDSYYLMAKGDPRVFTVREHHGTYFHYQIRDLWQGAFKTVDGTDIAYLRIRKNGATVVELKRTPELYASDIEFRGMTLSVVYPYVTHPRPVDGAFLSTFAQALASLQRTYAVDAGAASLAKYGLDKPAGELDLTDGKGVSQHVSIGKSDGQVVFIKFETDPTVYASDASLLQIIDIAPFQFVNKYAVILKLDTVDRLTFQAGSVTHTLDIRRLKAGSEDGASWLVDGRAVDEKTFKDFYVSAVSLQTDSLFNDAVPTGAPGLTMTFTLNTGSVRTFAVRFVPYSQEFYAVVKGGKSDILVNKAQVKFLLQKLDELVSAAKS